MKKNLLLVLITFLSFSSYGQVNFEQGYFINNSDERITCLIRNFDWMSNPYTIDYKLSENADTQTATITSVKEFGINNNSKYIRATVDIDRSSKVISDLSHFRNPVFKEETLFLKVLIEGDANLYEYVDGNLNRYFYNKKNTDIAQLVFKTYKESGSTMGRNELFKQQLWTKVKCDNFKINDIERLEYKRKDLLKYFVMYNSCNDAEVTKYDQTEQKDLFNLTVRPRVNTASLNLDPLGSSKDVDFGNNIGYGLGVEAELILPFKKNKWSVIFETAYQIYEAEKQLRLQLATVNYKSLELALGVRHNFFVNSKSNIFLNGSLVYDLTGSSKIDYEFSSDEDIKSSYRFAFGAGYKHNDKISLEFKYYLKKSISDSNSGVISQYKMMSLILGYSFF